MRKGFPAVVLPVLALGSTASHAVPVSWTDWTASAPSQATGTLDVQGTPVGVAFSGTWGFVQSSGSGINYWNPPGPYQSGLVDNAPPGTDIVALNTGGTATVTFSEPVRDPLLALVSWNGNTVDFGVPIEILSFGQGYWGNGTPVLNDSGTGFFGQGEVHGVIRLPGVHSAVEFTHTSENWHGFTVGVVGLGTVVPVPAAAWLFGSGLLGLAGLAHTRRTTPPGT